MTEEKFPGAYAFESSLDLAGMKEALSRTGRSWRWGESDLHGEYLFTELDDGVTRLRIFADEKKYMLHVRWSGSADSMDRRAIEEIVQRDVLPVVNATTVVPTEFWD